MFSQSGTWCGFDFENCSSGCYRSHKKVATQLAQVREALSSVTLEKDALTRELTRLRASVTPTVPKKVIHFVSQTMFRDGRKPP